MSAGPTCARSSSVAANSQGRKRSSVQVTRVPSRCQTSARPLRSAQTETMPGVGSHPNSQVSSAVVIGGMRETNNRRTYAVASLCVTTPRFLPAPAWYFTIICMLFLRSTSAKTTYKNMARVALSQAHRANCVSSKLFECGGSYETLRQHSILLLPDQVQRLALSKIRSVEV